MTDRIDEIVRQKISPDIRGPIGVDRVRTFARVVGREVEREYVTGSPIARAARRMGVSIDETSPASAVPGQAQHEHVSDDERQRYSYGDLPDALLIAGKSSITQLGPDHMSTEVSKHLMGRTMSAVQQDPQTEIDEVWRQIGEAKVLGDIEALSRENIALLDGVVNVSYDLASNYFNPQLQNQPASAQAAA